MPLLGAAAVDVLVLAAVKPSVSATGWGSALACVLVATSVRASALCAFTALGWPVARASTLGSGVALDFSYVRAPVRDSVVPAWAAGVSVFLKWSVVQ
jgi:hypothetical protein